MEVENAQSYQKIKRNAGSEPVQLDRAIEFGKSLQDLETIGVMDTSSRSLQEKNKSVMDPNFYAQQQFSKVTFSGTSMEERSPHFVEDSMFDCYPHLRMARVPAQPLQSFTLIKELPSSSAADVFSVSQNVIILTRDNNVKVRKSIEVPEDHWEVEEGNRIKKYLKPVLCLEYKPSEDLELEESSSKTETSSNSDWPENQEICSEYQSPISAANLLVTNTIHQAKGQHRTLIFHYGDPDRWTFPSYSEITKLTSHWPPVGDFTKEIGLISIERYIVENSLLKEDWKYVITFEGAQSDKASDLYFYEAKFSLPTIIYPIAQVTASLFFNIEASRVVPALCPLKVSFYTEISRHVIEAKNYPLRDNILLRILDMKLCHIRNIKF